MSEIKHRYRILEAIDQLRRRKARPDVNRICSFMFRRFSVSCGETKSDLQKLIEAEIVIKVDYKGNTSYRNAAKWAMLPNYKNKQVIDSWNTSSILSSAVAELIVLEPDYLDIGVPPPELERHLLGKDHRRFNRKNLDIILKRELDCGTLVKLENGNYFLGEHTTNNRPQQSNSPTKSPNKSSFNSKPTKVKKSPNKSIQNLQPISASPPEPVMEKAKIVEMKEESKVKVEENSNSSTSTTNNAENGTNVGFRVGGRQKRAKVMFDPSDNNLPKGRRKSSTTRQSSSSSSSSSFNSLLRAHNNINTSKHNNSINSSSSVVNGQQQNGIKQQVTTVVNSSSAASSSVAGGGKGGGGVTPIVLNQQQTAATVAPVTPGLCSLCHSFGTRVKGVPERLISCSDCTSSKAHLSCVDSDYVGSVRGRNGLWQCLTCKTCTFCDETSKTGLLAACSSCGDGYHYICHTPQIPFNLHNVARWKCYKCSENNLKDDKPNKKEEPPEVVPVTTTETKDVEMKEIPSIQAKKIISISTPTAAVLQMLPTSAASVPVLTNSAVPPRGAASSAVSTESKPPTAETFLSASTPEKSFLPATVPSPRRALGSDEGVAELKEHKPARAQLKDRVAVPANCFLDPYEGCPIDETIPDASLWSADEVYQYFEKYFDAELVKVFKEQEIDGKSLLLMKRSDVISGLCVKLGPALKLYRRVKQLQIRRSDPKLLWS